jgi:uncharacterized protein (DUF1778 family)
MSQAQTATKIGFQLASKLQGITDEKVIKALSIEAWKELSEAITNPTTFSTRGLSNVRKAIKEAFPDSETQKPGYYQTTQGKGQVSRYEHLSLWYLTSNTDRWEITGDKTRQTYFENLPELPTSQPEPQPEPQSEPQPELQSKPQPEPLTLENMTLENLQLDTETQTIVQEALKHSGMSLPDFIKQACKVHATIVVGKAKKAENINISNIPTSELLNNTSYRTLPGRAEELTNRAIQAIMHHNNMATEKSQKWCITATAINALTGSKTTLIKPVMEQYKVMINDHNIKHGLNPYDNRGRSTSIEQDIDFVNFSETDVPVAIPVTETPVTETDISNIPVPTPTSKVTPVKKQPVVTMPLTSSTLDIWSKLQENPNSKIRIKDGSKALHYVKISESEMKIEEIDEIIKF